MAPSSSVIFIISTFNNSTSLLPFFILPIFYHYHSLSLLFFIIPIFIFHILCHCYSLSLPYFIITIFRYSYFLSFLFFTTPIFYHSYFLSLPFFIIPIFYHYYFYHFHFYHSYFSIITIFIFIITASPHQLPFILLLSGVVNTLSNAFDGAKSSYLRADFLSLNWNEF